MDLIVSLLVLLVVVVAGAYYVAKVNVDTWEKMNQPVRTLAELPVRSQARIRVRVLSCQFPVDTPITDRECCVYSTFICSEDCEGPATVLLSQREEAPFRVGDVTGELLLHLHGDWDLDASLTTSREVTEAEERDAIAKFLNSRLWGSNVRFSEGMVQTGMTVDIVGEFVKSGDELHVWGALLFVPDAQGDDRLPAAGPTP